MDKTLETGKAFFSVVIQGQTYLNILYLLLGNTQEPIPSPLPPDEGWPKYDPAPPAKAPNP
jgi:hypothetical protein